MTDASQGRPQLACPLCSGTRFRRERGRSNSHWGFSAHRLTLMICDRCSYVLHFYDKRGYFLAP